MRERSPPFRRRASVARAAASAAAGRRLLVAALRGLRFGLRRIGGLRRGLRSLVLEVGRVPAAALQLEAGRGDHLREARLAALRADGERRIAHLLQELLLVAAALAAVLVDRHGLSREIAF